MISIALSSSNRLHLTQAEADRLAETLRQELVCRIADHDDDLVMVADISLSLAEAWRLLDRLENLLTEPEVDWPVEGF